MRKSLLLASLALLAPAVAHAGPFINGSFEDSTNDPGAGFVTLGNGSTAINGWQVFGASIDYIGGYWEAADGTHSVDLDGNGVGGIMQSFDTIEGVTYRVSFALAGNPDGGPPTKLLSTLGTGGLPQTFTFTTTGQTRDDMGWQMFSYEFTAGGSTSSISFTSLTPGSFGAALDIVSVTAVPEPATWGLMILGFGGVGAALRTRRSRALAAA